MSFMKRLLSITCIPQCERWLGLIVGLFVLLFCALTDPPADLPLQAWRCIGMGTMMAIWWATEAMPIPVTSLLPIILIPILGLGSIKTATAPYANPTIYLFFGGFLLGLAMERCNLHRRIALNILSRVGSSPRRQLAGFMIATGFISMWVSNTATAIMMLPIGTSVCAVVTQGQDPQESRRFSSALMLAIAYSASIGGMATLIGTPPNAILRAFLAEHYNIVIGFGEWMLLGVPLSLVLSVFIWWWLSRAPFRLEGSQVNSLIQEQVEKLGPMSRSEIMTAAAFGAAAVCWVCQPLIASWLPFVDDTLIAMFFGLLLFILPVNLSNREFLLDWREASRMPWGVLLLFGGGLSLAGSITASGLSTWLAQVLGGLQAVPIFLMLLIIAYLIQFLTEFTSNTATAAAFLPLVGAMAVAQGILPSTYAIPAALAASCAFLLPVSTPPNALVFGSGAVTINEMMRAGFALTLFSGVVVATFAFILVPVLF